MGWKQDGVSRRLSKPRTNNSSSLSLLDFSDPAPATSSTLSSSDMDYFGDAPIVTSQGERRSRRTSRSTLRAYLYGSRDESSQNLSSDDDESPSKENTGRSRSSKKRASLVGSSLMQLSSAKYSTARLSNSSTSRLLSSDDIEEPAIVAQQIKQRAHNDILAAHNHIPSPIDEDKHVDSIFAPVRRKSLYTPGIATRNTSDILRKPPPQQGSQSALSEADKCYYYDPCHSVSSPLARLAALNVHNDGRSTPCTLNISHLGGLELGTLRVTNDSVPPVTNSNLQCPRSPSLISNAQDDCRKHSEETVERSFPSPLQSQDQSRISIASSTAASGRITGDDVNAEGQSGLARRSLEAPEPESSPSASTMANEYMAEVGPGPFLLSSNPTQALDSHRTGNIDDGSEAIGQLGLSSPLKWTNEVHESAYQGPGRSSLDKLPGEFSHSSTRISYASTYADPLDGAVKTDSGYNSYDSLDAHVTLEYERHRFGETSPCAVAIETDLPTLVHGTRAGTSTVPGPIETSSRSLSSQTVRKLQKLRPGSQTNTTPTLRVNDCSDVHHFSGLDVPRVPSPMVARHTERLQQFPALDHTFPSSHHVSREDSPEPACFMPSQVRFPSPANALESAITGFVAHCAYDGPMERMGQEHDRPGAKVSGGERCGELKLSENGFALGVKGQRKTQKKLVKNAEETRRRLIKEEKDLAKRLEKDRKLFEEQVKKCNRTERSRSRISRGRRKSSDYRQSHCEDGTNIADFGTVAESLGSGPYDVATSIHPKSSREVRDRSPYQIARTSSVLRAQLPTSNEGISRFPYERQCSSFRSQSRGRPTIPLDEISKHRRSSFDGKSQPRPTFDGEPPMPALYAPYRQAIVSDAEGSRPVQQMAVPGSASGRLPYDSGSKPNESPRPQSMFLPISVATTSHPSNMNNPFDVDTRGRTIPNLWSKGSLEKRTEKGSRHEDEDEECTDDLQSQVLATDDVWQAQRQAWAERRKSAGEALRHQHPLSGERRTDSRNDTDGKEKASPPSTSAIFGLSGRYQGGLQYGYEPGCGLGGSAGTRPARNGASRKSVIVSQGFGLDLSDVPIFVAASPTT